VNKLRWGKFYWSDWSDDPALASCSLAAQGLWMRLLCIAAQGTPYGHVTINGNAPDTLTLAKLMRCKQGQLGRLIAELERKGVAHRGACGCLMSRRMESDGILARLRSKSGQAGAKARYGRDFAMANDGGLPSHESHYSHKAEQESPRSPPKGGRARRARMNGARKESRNAMCDIIAEELEEAANAEAANARWGGATVVPIAGRAHRREHDT
jgi:hypothetical protein